MQPEDLLLHLHHPATCPYPQPDRSNPCPPSHVSKIHFNIILSSTRGSYKWFPCKHFEERKYIFPLPGIEAWSFGLPIRILDTA
jgi:hypothetical protein